MRLLTRYFFILCIYQIAFYAQKAKPSEYRVVHYDVESGLPINIVKTIFQDRLGFVWIGTDSGFCRFDGLRFETFESDITSPFIKNFYETDDGIFYILTDSGIGRFHDNRLYSHFQPEDDSLTVLSPVFPKNMFEDNQSRLWIAEPNAIVRSQNNSLKRYPFPEDQQADSYDCSFFFFHDPWDRLITLSNRGGIFFFDDGQDRFSRIEHNIHDPQLRVYSCLNTPEGQTFIGTNQGVFRLNTTSLDTHWRLDSVVSLSSVSSLEMNKEGHLLIGTFDSGLYSICPPFKQNELQKINELPYKTIYDLYRTREGAVWAASNEGIAVITPKWFEAKTKEFSNSMITSMTQGPGNSCYVSDGTLIYQISRKGNDTVVTPLDLELQHSVTALESIDETLYAGFREGYLEIIRNQDRQRIDLPNIANKVVFFLSSDSENRIWICMDGLTGVLLISPDRTVSHYAEAEGLTTHINVIREGPHGEIYAGGNGPGDFLFRYDSSQDRFVSTGYIQDRPEGLMINDLSIAPGGNVWLAANLGVWIFTGEDCVPFPSPLDAWNGSPQSILYDEGNVWVGAVRGLYRFSQEQWIRYSVKEGLPSHTLSYRARVHTPEGGLYFATSNGIACWSNKTIDTEFTPAPWIRTIRINQKDIDPNSDASSLVFPYHSFLETDFVSLIYPPGNLRYQYRMQHQNGQWRNLKEENSLHIPGLPAGQHTLQIRAQKNGYLWSFPTTFSFSVNEPFYFTFWAFGVYVILIFIGFLAFKWLIRIIRERAHSKRALLESEERFRHLVQSSAGVFIYLTPQMVITEFNSEAELLFQKKREDILHHPLQELFSKRSEFDIFDREIQRLLHTESTAHFESPLISPQTGLRYLFWTIRKISNDEGETIGMIVLGQDVTELQKIQDELQAAKEIAEHANHAKSDFLAKMSHELRTPLNSIIGFSRIITKRCSVQMQKRDQTYLSRITQNGEHLLQLINEILDLSRVEAGRMEINRSMVFLDVLIQETIEQLESHAYNKNLEIVTKVPSHVSPIHTDSRMLKQVLINLVGNAIKFTMKGTVTVQLLVNSDNGIPAQLIVSDTGIGILPERLHTIFEAFEQIDDSKSRKFEGTGLGLSISKSFCSLLGYRIQVQSELNKGSTFTLSMNAS